MLTKPLNVSLLLLLFLGLSLLWYQGSTSSQEFTKLAVELHGAFIVTFLGLYVSFYFSRTQEHEREKRESEKLYLGSLKLIWSELDLNERAIKPLLEALKAMPKELGKFYDSYKFLIKISRGIKTKAFYGLINSGAMHEISKNDELFNSLQQAYYNVELAINGLSLSQEVFKEYQGVDAERIPEHQIKQVREMVIKEEKKLGNTLIFISKAKKIAHEELTKKGITFKEDGEIIASMG